MPRTKSEISIIGDETNADQTEQVSQAAEVLIKPHHSDALSGDMRTITIHSSELDGGSDAVFVSHNGYAFQIPRDKPFQIPAEVAQILSDAKETTYKHGGNGQIVESSRQRYAMSVSA